MKEINSNKKLKDKLKSNKIYFEFIILSTNVYDVLALDPLAKGVEGVGKIVPKAKPEVKKPKVVR
jgi:hypothetical protein